MPSSNILNTLWNGDYRKALGGLGGRPIVSSNVQNQLFFGGGGGAGDGNNNANNDGGDGGGLVFMIVESTISGTGIISANGQDGFNTVSGHNDAPGGGGGGGTIAIQAQTINNTITIRANGGRGGNQLITNDEAEGPGGGGGGGVIAIRANSDASVKQVLGGQNGTSTSAAITEFTANGATSGNTGTITSVSVSLFNTRCLANLGVNKTINNNTPNVGSTVVFTINISNSGPNPATNVVVNDVIPSGYTFLSSTASQGSYSNVSGVWTVGNLGIGGTATLNITVSVNSSGVYTNTATITTNDQDDPDTLNNRSSITPNPNFPPVANDDTFSPSIPEDDPGATINILNNDTDPNGNPTAPTNAPGQFS
ncbi:MAG: DUF11 domain-containing protein, partial [Chitinophagales bacterium]|nr:DUF11 domain-containing protein [Chitinophagales bacterium]